MPNEKVDKRSLMGDSNMIDENMSLDMLAHGKSTSKPPLKTRPDFRNMEGYTETVIALAQLAVAEARKQPKLS